MKLTLCNKGTMLFCTVLLIYAVSGILLVLVGRDGSPGSEVNTLNPAAIPRSIHGWSSSEIQLTDEEYEIIQPDVYIFRDYEKDGEVINLYLAFYQTIEKSDHAHSPLICYPSQGWEIEEETEVTVGQEDGEGSLRVSRLIARKGERTEIVCFWYCAKGISATGLLEMRLQLMKNWFAVEDRRNCFIRVVGSCQTPPSAEENQRILAFIERMRPYLNEIFD